MGNRDIFCDHISVCQLVNKRLLKRFLLSSFTPCSSTKLEKLYMHCSKLEKMRINWFPEPLNLNKMWKSHLIWDKLEVWILWVMSLRFYTKIIWKDFKSENVTWNVIYMLSIKKENVNLATVGLATHLKSAKQQWAQALEGFLTPWARFTSSQLCCYKLHR